MKCTVSFPALPEIMQCPFFAVKATITKAAALKPKPNPKPAPKPSPKPAPKPSPKPAPKPSPKPKPGN